MIDLRITVSAGRLELDKKHVRQVLRAAGGEILARARQLASGSGSGRVYRGPGGSAKYRGGYKPGRFQASAPGQSPARVTGFLARSTKVLPFKSGDGVAIRERAFYALFLEKGAKGGGRSFQQMPGKKGWRLYARGTRNVGKTRVLAPRPNLLTALAEKQGSIEARIAAAIMSGMKFQRVKLQRGSAASGP